MKNTNPPKNIPNTIWSKVNKKQKAYMEAFYPTLSHVLDYEISEYLNKSIENIKNNIILALFKYNNFDKLLDDSLTNLNSSGNPIYTDFIIIPKNNIKKSYYYNKDGENLFESIANNLEELNRLESGNLNSKNYWSAARSNTNKLIKSLKEFNKKNIQYYKQKKAPTPK